MAEENAQARKRAARRSMNFKAGKPLDAEPAAPETMGTEGGIVAEAKHEAAQAQAVEEAAEGGTGAPAEEAAEGEAPQTQAAEEAVEGGTGAPAEEAAEGEAAPGAAPETPPEEPLAAEAPATEAPASTEAAPPAMVEAAPEEPPMEAPMPAGPSHDELVDQYHEALMYGDKETANQLYKELQNQRYMENANRTRAEGEVAQQMAEYVAAAKELAAKHPELNQDGLAVDKMMALADLYRSNGSSPADALRQAAADLYPEEQAALSATEDTTTAPVSASATPETEASGEETPAEGESVSEGEKPGEGEKADEGEKSAEGSESEAPTRDDEAEGSSIPDMTARKERKAKLSVVPTASARNAPPPKEEAPTRSGAIAQMRKARGQG